MAGLMAGQPGCSRKENPPETPPSSAASGGNFKIKIRGLSLLEYQKDKHVLVIRMVDAGKLGMPAHSARLAIKKSAVDEDATSLQPTTKEQEGTSQERWLWNLAGQTVSVLDDADPADATVDSSTPSGEKPTLGDWKSMKWIPNLSQLTGATMINVADSSFSCIISLKHGKAEGEKPKGRVGDTALWTVKKTDGTQIAKQFYTDTVLYTRKLQGRTPVVTIGSGKVVVKSNANDEVVFENAAPDSGTTGNTITLGHFPAFFEVVDAAYKPTFTPDPTQLPSCTGCETDPVFCPPAWI